MSVETNYEKKTRRITDEKMKQILELVSEVNYGSVTLVIQDGLIVQVDRNEKFRIR